MAVAINTPIQAPTVNAGEVKPGENSLNQITSGPLALAMMAILRIMELYAQVIALSSQQKQWMATAQLSESTSQAAATRSAGMWAGLSQVAAGAIGIAGAGASFLFNNGIGAPDRVEVNEMGGNIKDLETQAAPLQAMEKAQMAKGNDNDNELAEASKVNERMEQFKAGDYSEALPKEAPLKETAQAKEQRITANKANDEVTRQALAKYKRAEPDEYQDFEKNFTTRLENLTRAIGSKTSLYSSKIQTWQARGQMATGLASGVSGAAQGIGSANQGQENAKAGLFGTSSQMAGDSAGTAGKKMEDAFSSQNAEMQIISALRQAGNAQA